MSVVKTDLILRLLHLLFAIGTFSVPSQTMLICVSFTSVRAPSPARDGPSPRGFVVTFPQPQPILRQPLLPIKQACDAKLNWFRRSGKEKDVFKSLCVQLSLLL